MTAAVDGEILDGSGARQMYWVKRSWRLGRLKPRLCRGRCSRSNPPTHALRTGRLGGDFTRPGIAHLMTRLESPGGRSRCRPCSGQRGSRIPSDALQNRE